MIARSSQARDPGKARGVTARMRAERSREMEFKEGFDSQVAEPVCIGPTLYVSLTMRSEIDAVSDLVDRLMPLIKISYRARGDECDVEIALREALANAVLHGNKLDVEKKVYISCCIRPGSDLFIVIRDEGAGFDPRAVPDPTSVENITLENGRGIFLMNLIMDDVHFEGGGTEVHLYKCFKLRRE
jgi:serine/threonine-protein kinase RsbW